MASQQEILEAIREELAAIKVPGAETAQPDTTWRTSTSTRSTSSSSSRRSRTATTSRSPTAELKWIATVGDAVALVRSCAAGRVGVMDGIVVTGRGVVSSLGEGADAFFEALLGSSSGIADGIGAVRRLRPRAP